MECNATVVRGVTSRLNFTWSSDNTTVRTAEGTSSSVNPLIYIDNYTTGILNESDIGVVYYCTASLDNEQGTMATVNITLDESISKYTLYIACVYTCILYSKGFYQQCSPRIY